MLCDRHCKHVCLTSPDLLIQPWNSWSHETVPAGRLCLAHRLQAWSGWTALIMNWGLIVCLCPTSFSLSPSPWGCIQALIFRWYLLKFGCSFPPEGSLRRTHYWWRHFLWIGWFIPTRCSMWDLATEALYHFTYLLNDDTQANTESNKVTSFWLVIPSVAQDTVTLGGGR